MNKIGGLKNQNKEGGFDLVYFILSDIPHNTKNLDLDS